MDDEETDTNNVPTPETTPTPVTTPTAPVEGSVVVSEENVRKGIMSAFLSLFGSSTTAPTPTPEPVVTPEPTPTPQATTAPTTQPTITKEDALKALGWTEDTVKVVEVLAEQNRLKEVKKYAKEQVKDLGIELPETDFASNEEVDKYVTFAKSLVEKNGFVPKVKVKEEISGGANVGIIAPTNYEKEIMEAFARGDETTAFALLDQRDKALK